MEREQTQQYNRITYGTMKKPSIEQEVKNVRIGKGQLKFA